MERYLHVTCKSEFYTSVFIKKDRDVESGGGISNKPKYGQYKQIIDRIKRSL